MKDRHFDLGRRQNPDDRLISYQLVDAVPVHVHDVLNIMGDLGASDRVSVPVEKVEEPGRGLVVAPLVLQGEDGGEPHGSRAIQRKDFGSSDGSRVGPGSCSDTGRRL